MFGILKKIFDFAGSRRGLLLKSMLVAFAGAVFFRIAIYGADDDLGHGGFRRAGKPVAGGGHYAGFCGRQNPVLLLLHQYGNGNRIFYGGGEASSHWGPFALYSHGLF